MTALTRSLLDRLKTSKGNILNENIAISDGMKSLTYSELVLEVAMLSTWMRLNDFKTIALNSANSIEWIVIDLACQEAAIACVPLPDFFSLKQLERCIIESKVDLLFTSSEALVDSLGESAVLLERISSPCEISAFKAHQSKDKSNTDKLSGCPSGTQKITFTSGSTGDPKGVCLSADHQWQTATSIAKTINIASPKHLCLLPLSTLLENVAGVYAPLLSSGIVIVPDDTERGLSGSSGLNLPALLACISRSKPDSMILLPQLLSALIAACEGGWNPPQSLRFIAVGGSRVSASLLQRAISFGLPVYEGYGLSECASVIALNTPYHNKPGKVGQLMPHCQLHIQGDEIVVSKPVFLGYLNKRESWYPDSVSTGDLGAFDGSYLQVSGRQKNVIISSFGRNISPEWVESELCAKPIFSYCFIFGDARPHLIALISAADEVSNDDINTWIENVNQGLPDYARVKKWQRFEITQWYGLLTDNGRPKRRLIEQKYASAIAKLYQTTASHRQHKTLDTTHQKAP